MKNLFISMGEDVSVRNFVDGAIEYQELPAAQIATLVEKTRSHGGKVTAYFDFGSMPSDKKKREFRELVDAFEKVTGVRLSIDDFLMKPSDEIEETLPNFNFNPTVTDEMSMLAVEYYFTMDENVDILDGRFSVSDTGMNFHYFKKAG